MPSIFQQPEMPPNESPTQEQGPNLQEGYYICNITNCNFPHGPPKFWFGNEYQVIICAENDYLASPGLRHRQWRLMNENGDEFIYYYRPTGDVSSAYFTVTYFLSKNVYN